MNYMSITAWFFIMIAFVVLQGFFSMQEMLLLSKEKVRLSSNKHKSRVSRWSLELLSDPERLYITTLILVNAALVMGSQASRNFYDAIHLPQNIAPLTQIPIVIIFAELPALFAARKYTHSLGSWGIPFIYLFSKLIQPLVYVIKKLLRINTKHKGHDLHLDLRTVINDWAVQSWGSKEILQEITKRIYYLNTVGLISFVQPMNVLHYTYRQRSLNSVKKNILNNKQDIIYIKSSSGYLSSYISISDLLSFNKKDSVEMYMKPLHHVKSSISVLDAMNIMKKRNIPVLYVNDGLGSKVGVVTFKQLEQYIFPQPTKKNTDRGRIVLDKKFSTHVTVGELFKEYGIFKTQNKKDTLLQLINKYTSHPLEKGESVIIDNIRIKIIESTIIGSKVVELESISF